MLQLHLSDQQYHCLLRCGCTLEVLWYVFCSFRGNQNPHLPVWFSSQRANNAASAMCGQHFFKYWSIQPFKCLTQWPPFPDDIFKCILLNENVWISIKISLKFVPKGPINNIQALVQIMAWRRPGDKPLSEPMMVSLLTHICVTRPQWINTCIHVTKIDYAF